MSARPPIAIRADGGGAIGMGHVHRCAALAQALEAQGANCRLLTQTPDAFAGVHDGEIIATSDDALASHLANNPASAFIGDWKHTPFELLPALRRHAPVILLGGDGRPGEADLLIRQGFAERDDETSLSGASHIILKPAFQDLPPRRTANRVKRLLISLGGGGHAVLDGVVDAVARQPETQDWTVVITDGDGLERARRVHAGAERDWTGPARRNDLADDMGKSDLAILAGGTTLHEAAAAGLPALCLPVAGNQMRRADTFERLGLGLRLDPDRLEDLPAALLSLAADRDRRDQMAKRGQALVDGAGAARCAQAILDLAEAQRMQA